MENREGLNIMPSHPEDTAAAAAAAAGIPNDPTAQFWWTLVHQQPLQIQFASSSAPPLLSSLQLPKAISTPTQQQQQQQQQRQQDLIRYHHHQQQQQPALIDSMSTMTSSEVLDDDPSIITEDSIARHNHQNQPGNLLDEYDEENDDDDDDDIPHPHQYLPLSQQQQQQQKPQRRPRRRRQRKLWVAASPEGDGQDYLEVAMATSTVSGGGGDAADHTTPVFQMLMQYSPYTTTLRPEDASEGAKCNSLVSTLVHEEFDDDEDDDDDGDLGEKGEVERRQHDHRQAEDDEQKAKTKGDGRHRHRKHGPSSIKTHETPVAVATSNRSSPFSQRRPPSISTTTTSTLQRGGETTNRGDDVVDHDNTLYHHHHRPSLELKLSTTFDEAMDEVALLLDQQTSQPKPNVTMAARTKRTNSINQHDMVLSDEAYHEAIQRAECEVEKALQQYRTTTTTNTTTTTASTATTLATTRTDESKSLQELPVPATTTTTRPASRRNSKSSSSRTATPTISNQRDGEQNDHDHAFSHNHARHSTPSSTTIEATRLSSNHVQDETHQETNAAASTKQSFSLTSSVPANNPTDSHLLVRQPPPPQQQQQETSPRKAEMERRHREQLDQLRVSNMEELSAAKALYEQETDRIRQDYERNFRTQLYRLELVKERQMAFLQERYQQELEDNKTRSQEQMQQMKQELKMKLVDLCRDTFEREKRQAVEEAVTDLSKQLQETREHAVLLEQERLSLLEEMDRSARQTKLQHEMDLDMVKRKVREHVEELKSLQLLEIQSLHMEKDEAIVMATKSATEFAQVGRELIAQLKRKLDLAQQKVRLLLKEKKEVAEENDLVVEAIRGEHAMVQRNLKERIARLKRQLREQHALAAAAAASAKQVVDIQGVGVKERGTTRMQDGSSPKESPVDTADVLTRENELIRAEMEAALQSLDEERSKRSQIVGLLAQRSQQANFLLDHLCKCHESAVAEASVVQEQHQNLEANLVLNSVASPSTDLKDRPSPNQRDKMSNRKQVSEVPKMAAPEAVKKVSEPTKRISREPVKRGQQEPAKRVAPEPTKRITQETVRRVVHETPRNVPKTTRSSPNAATKRGQSQSSPGILGASPKLVFYSKPARGKAAVTAKGFSDVFSLIAKQPKVERRVASMLRSDAGLDEYKSAASNSKPTSEQSSFNPTAASTSTCEMALKGDSALALQSVDKDANPPSFEPESSPCQDIAASSSCDSDLGELASRMEENDSAMKAELKVPNPVRQQDSRDVFKAMQPSAADKRLPTAAKSPQFTMHFEGTSHFEDMSNGSSGHLVELLPGSSDIEGVDDPFTHMEDDMTIDSHTWESAFVEKPVSVKKRVALYEYLASGSSSVSEASSHTPHFNLKSSSPARRSISVEVEESRREKRGPRFEDV